MKKIRIRRPLAPRPSAARTAKFLEAGKKSHWPKGVSGNPAGKPGVSIKSYKEFVEACREASPRALERLREALNCLGRSTARTILTASALVLERLLKSCRRHDRRHARSRRSCDPAGRGVLGQHVRRAA